MKIARVVTNTYQVPLARPWGDTTHRIAHLELIVTDIMTEDGSCGTGFSYTVGMGGKSIQSLLDWYISPLLIGETVDPRYQWHRLWHRCHDAGGGGILTMALAAVDIALWDLVAKSRNQSLVDTLGRFRQTIPVYGSGVNLNLDLTQLESQIGRWLKAGYEAFKIKVGKPDLTEDIERLKLARDLIGPNRPLMVDANQGWDVTTAARRIRAYEDFNLLWVEEPLLSDDVEGHARLKSLVNTPIAIGENVYTKYQYNEYLRLGACDFVQADVIRVGGITPYLEIASLAHTWDVPLAPHFMLEITGQVLCSVPNAFILEDVEGGSFRELGILAEDVGVSKGCFTPPSQPGHGIVFDRKKMEPYLLHQPDGAAHTV
ncbi:mandelate racemase/muconate lactonizing enzyme family protein [Alicyclobacillus fodiniaquatilis]|jgi:L-alanine-DL-glutamate epimerase-like enolase superfamily enzyme|uniref:Mandelate racemase/muconate lactonizing enzyme family protein n=1 Tax=Alicyclobacillus fodiniaquatilis TaxID=1661150 RepID=A0ABW4JJ57_9BACL